MQIPQFVKDILAKYGMYILVALVVLFLILRFTVFRKRSAPEDKGDQTEEVQEEEMEGQRETEGQGEMPPPVVMSEPTDDKYYIILGNELEGNTSSEMATTDVEMCKKTCDDESDCMAFLIQKDANKCILKSSVNNFVKSNKEYTSYIKKNANIPGNVSSFMNDFQVNAVGELPAENSSEEPEPFGTGFDECAAKCRTDSDCQGFSFNHDDAQCIIRKREVNLSPGYLDASKFQYYQRRIAGMSPPSPSPQVPTTSSSSGTVPIPPPPEVPSPASPAPTPETASASVTNPISPAPGAETEAPDTASTPQTMGTPAPEQAPSTVPVVAALDQPVTVSPAQAPASIPSSLYKYEARENILFDENAPTPLASFSVLNTCFDKCNEMEDCDTVVEDELGVCSLYSRATDGGFKTSQPAEPKYYFKVGK